MSEDNFIIRRIKDVCNDNHWTYYRLAKESQIPYTTLMNMFKKNTMPTIPTLNRICTGFGITLSQFFQDTSKAITLTEEQIRLLDAFTSLSVEKKAFCLKLIEEIKELP